MRLGNPASPVFPTWDKFSAASYRDTQGSRYRQWIRADDSLTIVRLWSSVSTRSTDLRRAAALAAGRPLCHEAQAEAAAATLGLRAFVLPPRDVWAGNS